MPHHSRPLGFWLGRKLSRRHALTAMVSTAAVGLLAACQQPAATPSLAPQATAAKPAATTAPAPAPTAAPAAVATTAPAPPPTAAAKEQPKKGGTAKIAYHGEPSGLDPVFTTEFATAEYCCNMFEGLLAHDSKYAPKPMLAESYEASKDGKAFTFVLRKGVPFHNGKEMTSADVVASLKRWFAIGNTGRTLASRVDQVEAKEKYNVVVTLNQPTGLLPTFLALPEGIIVPEEIANAVGKDRMKEIIGTGPYKLAEWLPDRYIRMVRHDNYAALSSEPDYQVGRKVAYFDEMRWYPVVEPSVRGDGLATGEYHFVSQLSTDSYPNAKNNPNITPYVVKPFQWLAVHLNKKQGMFTNLKMRQAVQKIVSCDPAGRAAMGLPEFYRLDHSISSPESSWYVDGGKELYDKPNLDEAKVLLKEAGYNGEPVVWLAVKDNFANYNMSLTIKGQLEAAGMKVDLQTIDGASMSTRRANPALWNVFCTGHPSLTHPILQAFMNSSWPGWWVNDQKDKLVSDLMGEIDEKKSLSMINDLQTLFYKDVPAIKVFDQFLLHGARKEFRGYLNKFRLYFVPCWLA